MEHPDHTIVQDPEAQKLAQDMSLQAQPEAAEGAPELPGYVLRRLLGRGSFGEVWAATQSGSGQSVAVKIFTQPRGLDFRYLQHEIKRLRQVAEHPHVVTLLDADFHHDPPFFCMGLYQQSLAVWRQENGQPEVDRAVRWMDQIGQALQFTHDKGLLHCDLKPANVLLDAEGRVKVADYGQAVERGLPGSAVGSLGYMAPEQASLADSSPDVRWDIYGLGATIYYMLTGRPPRLSDQTRETMGSITDPTERLERYRQVVAESPLVPLRELNAKVDIELASLITACLDLDPSRRPQNVSELLEDLARRRENRPLLCRRPWGLWYWGHKFARRNLLGLALVAVVMGSATAGAAEYYRRSEEQRRTMAMQQFDMGWQVAKSGHTAEAALWWAKTLETDSNILPARAALDSVSLKLMDELVHGQAPVINVSCTPDGAWMASADALGVLKLWQDGKVVSTIEGLRGGDPDVYALTPTQFAFTPDGRHVITAKGFQALGQDQPLVLFRGEVAIDPDGHGALVTSPGQTMVFSPETQKFSNVVAPREVASVAFAPGQASFAVRGVDGKVDLYHQGNLVKSGLHQMVGAIAFSPDGKFLVTCSEDRTAKVWRADSGEETSSLDHGWRVMSARFTTDGHLVTSLYNGEVRIWDVSSGLAVMHSPMRHSWLAYGTISNPEEDLFASFGVDGQARVWRSANGAAYSPWYQHGSAIRDVAFVGSQEKLVTAGQDGRLRVWALGEERTMGGQLDLGPEQEIQSVAIASDNQRYAVAWHTFPTGGGALMLSRGEDQRWPLAPAGTKVNEVVFSPDGGKVASASVDGKGRVFDRQGKPIEEISHPSSVVALSYSADGKTLLSASTDGTIKLNGVNAKVLSLGGQLIDARISDDGRLVGAAGPEGHGAVWDAQTGREIYREKYGAPLRKVIFDRQGRQALFCAQDGVAQLINLASKEERAFKHDLLVANGSFDSLGKRLVTTSLDGNINVWDTRTGAPLPSPTGHDGPVLIGQFSPDDSLILSVSKDGSAQLWESLTGLPFGLPIRHQRVAYDGCFSADGKLVVTGGHDGVVKITDVPLQTGAGIPNTRELERTLGSRLAHGQGGTVCESVSVVGSVTSAEKKDKKS
jgi:WD40 repeat protein